MAEQSITDLLDSVIARYQPGGAYGEAALGTLETRKKKTLASQRQSLTSSGLSGTTVSAGLGKKFEEDIGTPTRLGIEETRVGALTQAMQAKAGFMERGQARQDQLLKDAYERFAQQRQERTRNQQLMAERNRLNYESSRKGWMFQGLGGGGTTSGGGTPSMPPDPWGNYQGGDTTDGVPGSTGEAVQNLSIGSQTPEGAASGTETTQQTQSGADTTDYKFKWNPNSGVPYDTWVKEMNKLGHTSLAPKPTGGTPQIFESQPYRAFT